MLIYLIAGEPSGDLLGGRLMAALKERLGEGVSFAGIGGESMRAEGLTSLFPMTELSVMGLVEVLPRIPKILRRVKQTISDIETKRPDALVTIDSWGFNGRIQAGLKARGVPVPRIHYVAPMVWAWKSGRTKTLARVLDLLLTLLPNEPEWFEKEGLKTLHVGHPVIEGAASRGDGAAFRVRHGFAPDRKLLCVLPGSRHSETAKLLAPFGETIALLARRFPDLAVVVPTVETVADEVSQAVKSWALPSMVVRGPEKYDAFAACDAALAASGTVALELAMARLPAVITYKVSPVSAFIATRFLGLSLKFVTLVNILVDEAVMPELLQDDCRPDKLAAAVEHLLTDEAARALQAAGARRALEKLGLGGESPGKRAADAVIDFIRQGKEQRNG
ncbi:lipid-A-disaccharide synthase [Paramagnetospirillum magneticum]|uniref:Lipid-A-disaccharide synthase n=1 Tax=Paramagnetospirillum magneticum (strain ATCC 700264 / AMB-1) TaxID=342108 RepID=LPXB_PARM1|nr:lipid-A-disaccharide synthase [Paramagnetospirillum magneticum]Q2W4D7.1 RecName: Full=Lipid-A-disaccharide synthase [Paramagnetospirillum magneticum AMB-1]BAE51288.1 Lipid A disaccharide synthetase [Paramagnetospirillum magneticum AMB-1]